MKPELRLIFHFQMVDTPEFRLFSRCFLSDQHEQIRGMLAAESWLTECS
jgi:hypothetical protein